MCYNKKSLTESHDRQYRETKYERIFSINGHAHEKLTNRCINVGKNKTHARTRTKKTQLRERISYIHQFTD